MLKKIDDNVYHIVYNLNWIMLLFWYGERIMRNSGVTDVLAKGEPKDLTDKNDPVYINKLKYTIRPILTYAYTFLFFYTVINYGNYDIEKIRDTASIEFLIIVFWFGERLLINTGIKDFILRLANRKYKRPINKLNKKHNTE